MHTPRDGTFQHSAGAEFSGGLKAGRVEKLTNVQLPRGGWRLLSLKFTPIRHCGNQGFCYPFAATDSGRLTLRLVRTRGRSLMNEHWSGA